MSDADYIQAFPIAFFEYLGYDIHKIPDRKEDLSSSTLQE